MNLRNVFDVRQVNVHAVERVVSVAAGVALLIGSLRIRSRWLAAPLAAGGGELLGRGLTGHCPVYGALGMSTAGAAPVGQDQPAESGERRFHDGRYDLVEEASWESFPASDPPAW